MKKLLAILVGTVLFLTSNAATGFVVGADVDSTTNQSTVIRMIVTAASGPYRIITNYGPGSDTSDYKSGTGTKTTRVVGLTDGTSYIATVSLLSGTGANDTIGTTSFVTLPTPVIPALSGIFIAPNKLRITGSINHPAKIFSIYGVGSLYDQYSDTFYAVPGAVDDTVILSVTSATSYNYLLLSYGAPYVTGAAAVLGNRGGGSFTTPASTEGDISMGFSIWGIDTARMQYSFTAGTLGTGTVTSYLFDSLGSTPLRTISSATPISGTNYVSVSLLNPNTYYRILSVYSRGSYRDSVWVNGRTLQVPSPTWNGGQTARVITTSSIAFTQLINANGSWACSDVSYAWRYRLSTGTIWTYSDTFSGISANVTLAGLMPSTIYVIELSTWNCGGLITRSYVEETNPGLPAPILGFTGGIEEDCGSLKVMNLSIDVATGDMANVFLLSSDNGISFDDTIRRYSVSSDINTGPVDVSGLNGNQTVYFKIVGVSRDGMVSYSSVISGTTIPANPPIINRSLVSVDYTTVTFDVFGSGECGTTNIDINIYNEWNTLIRTSTFNVGSTTYNFENRIITGLDPATNYRASFFATNSTGPVSTSDILFRTLGTSTGINEVANTDWTLETQVTVSNLLGQTLGRGMYKDILTDFGGKGLIFVTDTSGTTKKLVIQ